MLFQVKPETVALQEWGMRASPHHPPNQEAGLLPLTALREARLLVLQGLLLE